jgi:hypothetical protein
MASLKSWLIGLVFIASIGAGVRECVHSRWVVTPPVAGEPLQEMMTGVAPFEQNGFLLQPVAHFQVRAKLISWEPYSFGVESELSPIDYAVGWNRMSEDAVIQALNMRQGQRFFTYHWDDAPPIPPDEIIRSAANMHLIPANSTVEKKLKSARRGQHVNLRGVLVDVQGQGSRGGWRWNTSRTREDTGPGACEVFWVEAVEIDNG